MIEQFSLEVSYGRFALASGMVRLIIVIQNTRQARMQKTAIRTWTWRNNR
tara:strand:- start:507 stop:656 length:150 start_codon:yes stop_codon:yes gene_type:complete